MLMLKYTYKTLIYAILVVKVLLNSVFRSVYNVDQILTQEVSVPWHSTQGLR